MRRMINILALITFTWLLADALRIPDMLINFLLDGELPGLKANLPPSLMMAIVTLLAILVIFELLARRFGTFRRVRQVVVTHTRSHEWLPKWRFHRV